MNFDSHRGVVLGSFIVEYRVDRVLIRAGCEGSKLHCNDSIGLQHERCNVMLQSLARIRKQMAIDAAAIFNQRPSFPEVTSVIMFSSGGRVDGGGAVTNS